VEEKHQWFRAFALTVVLLMLPYSWPRVALPAEQPSSTHVWINEFLADNDSVIHDEYGEYDDVVELYNPGSELADLGGMYLTDDLSQPTKFRIADSISVPAGGFLLFWADSSPAQGIYHTNFALSKAGESIGLFDTDVNGNVPVDTYSFGPQATDVSQARCPDGGQVWFFDTSPTIGATNQPCSIPAKLFLPLVTRGKEAAPVTLPAPLPFRIDCGSDKAYTTVDGALFLPDREWDAQLNYGYVGGHPYLPTEWWEQNPVNGTRDPGLYKSQRQDWQEYRVSRIPNGDYLLTLRFEEQELHGPGLSVFDVTVEGRTVLDHLDLYDQGGRYQVIDRRFAVTITDGELNVIAKPVTGEARLSALEVIPRAPDSFAPDIPADLQSTPSYDAVLLDWADNIEDDLAEYRIYRAEHPAGPYTELTPGGTVYLSRYQDNAATSHVPYYYRLAAVDSFGNVSGQSGYAVAVPVDMKEATLPLYQLQVSAQNLALINRNVWTDQEVPALFVYEGSQWPAEVRYRGSVGRTLPKKSWKIKFPSDSPFPGQDNLNVDATWLDSSLLHSRLATEVFEAAGVRPPQAEHVLLALNGEYMGVYTRNEQVDEQFLRRTGRNPGASIYKVVDLFGQLQPDEESYRAYYEKETNKQLGYADLISFIELINKTSDSEFPAAISAVLDVQAFLDYYAAIVLVADSDSARHNIYMIHDLTTGKWEFVPWDLEVTFESGTAPIDMGTREHPWLSGRWNILRTRMLAVPDFRAYFCQRLADYMRTIFADVPMASRIDDAYRAIEQDGLRDWRKLEWEKHAWFLAAPNSIKAFVGQRKAFLNQERAVFCPGSG
jgi:hypothetical protein